MTSVIFTCSRLTRLPRSATAVLVAAALASIALVGAGPAVAATGGSALFTYTGVPQTFVVPAGVTQLIVTGVGAQGGFGYALGGSSPGAGASAGQVTAVLPVTPGQTLTVDVGGHGADADTSGDGGGSGSGGGDGNAIGGAGGRGSVGGGAGGGGATTILNSSGQILLVAGGGGGGGGGGGVGENGGNGGAGGMPPGNGASGTGAGSGNGGTGGGATSDLSQETGGDATYFTYGGGGGGGGGGASAALIANGKWGGGGGTGGSAGGTGAGGGGGGGAGSSYVESAAVGTPTFATSGKTGSGAVTINWSAPATTTALSVVVTQSSSQATLTATVAPPAGVSSPAPTGTVSFDDGNQFLGQVTLSGQSPGMAKLVTGALAPGQHTFTAVYGGDSVFAGSASNAVTQQVLTWTTISLNTSPTPGIIGQPETITATVIPNFAGGPPPTGTVRFCGPPIGCANIALPGKTPDVATYKTTIANVAAAVYLITATYQGDSVYPAGQATPGGGEFPVQAESPLAVSTASLAAGHVGSKYSATLSATGGVAPYRWSLASGSLPAGLSLAPTTGAITGTPTSPGTASFTVQATDTTVPSARTATRAFSLTIVPAPLAVTTVSLPAGKVGSAYSATATATGGVPPYHWSLAANALPAGLSLNPSTGAITGTPTSPGTTSFTLRVTDSATPTPVTATGPLTPLTVAQAIQAAVFVTQGGYSGVTSYPLGSHGNVSPLTDLTGSATGLDGTSAVAVSPTGTVYVASTGNEEIAEYPYSATGNLAPATTIIGGATGLSSPSGLALDPSGRLYAANYAAGTITAYAPGASGNATPVVNIGGPSTGLFGPAAVAFDAHGDLWVANLANNELLEFAPGANGDVAPIATVTGPDTGLSGPSAITLDGAGNLLVADTYGASLTEYATTANGDASPLRTISGASTGLNFPDGIDVDAAGNIYVANENGALEEFAPGANMDVAPSATVNGTSTGLSVPGQIAVAPPLSVATAHLAQARVGRRYVAHLEANLGTTPYRWRVIGGRLPAGLSLTPGGELRGVPRRAGIYRFTVQVRDSTHPRMTATRTLRLVVGRAERR